MPPKWTIHDQPDKGQEDAETGVLPEVFQYPREWWQDTLRLLGRGNKKASWWSQWQPPTLLRRSSSM
jgi:hypothetical protein